MCYIWVSSSSGAAPFQDFLHHMSWWQPGKLARFSEMVEAAMPRCAVGRLQCADIIVLGQIESTHKGFHEKTAKHDYVAKGRLSCRPAGRLLAR